MSRWVTAVLVTCALVVTGEQTTVFVQRQVDRAQPAKVKRKPATCDKYGFAGFC
jgi:hypothetical protein